MKLQWIGMGFLVFSSLAYADYCPKPNEIYTVDNGRITPQEPSGWMFGSMHKLSSTNVRFLWAAWAEQRTNPMEQRRVLCIYGNPDWGLYGVMLQTIKLVDKSQISKHSAWKAYGDGYYRCENSDPTQCPFG